MSLFAQAGSLEIANQSADVVKLAVGLELCSTEVNEAPVSDWPCRIENQPPRPGSAMTLASAYSGMSRVDGARATLRSSCAYSDYRG